MHVWTKEEIEFLRQYYPKHPRKELLKMFNKHFNSHITMGQLTDTLSRYDIKSGRTGYFQKGVPSSNYKPIGSERVNIHGYTVVKVSDQGSRYRQWVHKHKLIWEEVHGPIPKGHVVIFGDRNKQNFDIDNLLLVSRKQLIKLNQLNLIQDHAELTRTGVILADLRLKIGERKRANL